MKKGKYVRELVRDYVVLDLETTGMSRQYDEIIEIAMVKVRDGKVVDTFETLVRPSRGYVSRFITGLTGITNAMVKNAPYIEDVIDAALAFIGEDLIVGHNTSFDVGFLGAVCDIENNYADTVQFCKKLYPELTSHTLTDMTHYLCLSQNSHRAMKDVIATYELYETIQRELEERGLEMSDLFKTARRKKKEDEQADSEHLTKGLKCH